MSSKIQISHDAKCGTSVPATARHSAGRADGKPPRFAPGAERIAIAYAAAEGAAHGAVDKAIICGQLLNEQKAAVGFGNWLDWLKKHCPQISHDTATRWMGAAERSLESSGLARTLALPAFTGLSASMVLAAPEAELPKEALAARQLFFDFTEGKTMRECLAGVVVDGDEPHRITRAHNGSTRGGSQGEDRKAFEKFIKRGLRVVSSHLSHAKCFTPGQWDVVESEVERFCDSLGERTRAVFKRALKKEGK